MIRTAVCREVKLMCANYCQFVIMSSGRRTEEKWQLLLLGRLKPSSRQAVADMISLPSCAQCCHRASVLTLFHIAHSHQLSVKQLYVPEYGNMNE